ncbi:hypothetical protein P691DRAFT_788323 [Macrolepiota fuliginosa MF-IS2]|uniref:Uncharacterized protein n=1 Tax=Macrolepiota fuliginosa MF-IS2 TaxID=1400762 RepID=A0A9P6BZ97_9AGAR|nr:hypothetical protein P691DRAFT_788323 [Macrolepiota fuliginosa MF-IS2]
MFVFLKRAATTIPAWPPPTGAVVSTVRPFGPVACLPIINSRPSDGVTTVKPEFSTSFLVIFDISHGPIDCKGPSGTAILLLGIPLAPLDCCFEQETRENSVQGIDEYQSGSWRRNSTIVPAICTITTLKGPIIPAEHPAITEPTIVGDGFNSDLSAFACSTLAKLVRQEVAIALGSKGDEIT